MTSSILVCHWYATLGSETLEDFSANDTFRPLLQATTSPSNQTLCLEGAGAGYGRITCVIISDHPPSSILRRSRSL